MELLFLLLLFLGGVCFAFSAFRVPVGRVELIPLGLLFWILVPFLKTLNLN